MNLELTSFMELPNEEQNMTDKVASSCVKMYLSVASNVRTAFKNMKNVCTQRASRIVPFSRSKITKQPYSGNNYRVERVEQATLCTNMT